MRPAVIANSDVLRLCDGRIVLSWPEMSLTWWRAVIPDMLIRSRSISTLALLSMFMIASPSLSLMWSSNTTSSGNLTLRLPGLSLAKTLALRDMPQLSPVTLSRIEAGDCDVTSWRRPHSRVTRGHWIHAMCLLICYWHHGAQLTTETRPATTLSTARALKPATGPAQEGRHPIILMYFGLPQIMNKPGWVPADIITGDDTPGPRHRMLVTTVLLGLG